MAVNKIEIALKEALKKAMIKCNFVEDYEIDQITIEIPKEKSHGDYSTNTVSYTHLTLPTTPYV